MSGGAAPTRRWSQAADPAAPSIREPSPARLTSRTSVARGRRAIASGQPDLHRYVGYSGTSAWGHDRPPSVSGSGDAGRVSSVRFRPLGSLVTIVCSSAAGGGQGGGGGWTPPSVRPHKIVRAP